MASTSSASAPAHAHGFGPGKLLLNWLILVCLTFSTFGVSQIQMPVNYHLAAAICISVVKTTLVVLFFMHVRHSSNLTKLTVVSGFLWLAFMIFITLSDYWTRGWLDTFASGR